MNRCSSAERLNLKRKIIRKKAVNISGGGIFVQTTNPLPVGSEVLLRLAFPKVPKLIEVLGRVIWTNEYHKGMTSIPGMGIQFLNLNEESRRFINDLASV